MTFPVLPDGVKMRSSWRPIQSMITCAGDRVGGRNSGRLRISRAAWRTSLALGAPGPSATGEVGGDDLQVVALGANAPVVVLEGGDHGHDGARDDRGDGETDGDRHPPDVAQQHARNGEWHGHRVR